MQTPVNIFWFRRDIRLEDNAGLYHALTSRLPVLPLFIFDTNILDELDDRRDRRVNFIYDALLSIQETLAEYGSSLHIMHGTPGDAFRELITKYTVRAVYTNHDYEPYATKRDAEVAAILAAAGIGFHTFKDQVIFEKHEVVKDNAAPYTVYTPYSNKWISLLHERSTQVYNTEKHYNNFLKDKPGHILTLQDIGFLVADCKLTPTVDETIIRNYDTTRDIPAINGTTRLSAHLRFGVISIRKLVATALNLNGTFLKELVWREFYQMILWHFPDVVDHSFKKEYDKIQWLNSERDFEAWCEGRTGYPIVDAGMRELNETGFMHNRARMITASFLTKHLLIDWRWGEAYFAKKLLDYDLAANNGNWQWAAGCGCDAAPYFRIFNPYLQTEKFDSAHTYILKWVPELNSGSYPPPIVAHDYARKRCLEVYGKAVRPK